jgi:hypothetical protein
MFTTTCMAHHRRCAGVFLYKRKHVSPFIFFEAAKSAEIARNNTKNLPF